MLNKSAKFEIATYAHAVFVYADDNLILFSNSLNEILRGFVEIGIEVDKQYILRNFPNEQDSQKFSTLKANLQVKDIIDLPRFTLSSIRDNAYVTEGYAIVKPHAIKSGMKKGYEFFQNWLKEHKNP